MQYYSTVRFCICDGYVSSLQAYAWLATDASPRWFDKCRGIGVCRGRCHDFKSGGTNSASGASRKFFFDPPLFGQWGGQNIHYNRRWFYPLILIRIIDLALLNLKEMLEALTAQLTIDEM